MNRIKSVQVYINGIFDNIPDPSVRRAAYVHSYSVAGCCALLAGKRGLDMELATVIGLLHDIYTYKTGVSFLHSYNGAEMVRVVFKRELKDLFSESEQAIIKSAIYHHSDKDYIHDEYDELIKDADALQHYLYDVSSEKFLIKRLTKIASELGFAVPERLPSEETGKKSVYSQEKAADIAESLASKNITGDIAYLEFMKIIKYFPEENAFSELDHAWCAAFVYHCCTEAGLMLPLRTPHNSKETATFRFACVAAWYEWAERHSFCRYPNNGYIPLRGDIVVYDNIIPNENKPENSAWCDHIGIVLAYNNGMLKVAEGNVGNLNVSGITERRISANIGCYIHIPVDYEPDDRKTDFKTGRVRLEKL
jgi:hypothetical protein